MTQYAYSPDTGEYILTGAPAAWMGTTDVAPPAFDSASAGCFWRGTAWEIVVATPDLVKLRSAASALIDAAAGASRARYITIAPGQEATYLLKAQQAATFKAGGYAGVPPGLVQAEIDATGDTATQAADAILSMQAIWEAKAAQIESARRRGKVAVDASAGETAINTATAAAITELAGL